VVANCLVFNAVVYEEVGRIVFVYPDVQIVEAMLDCVTAGFIAPGVTLDIGR